MASFSLLRNLPYITPARESVWFAVSVSATALQCNDLSAVLSLQMSPKVSEIGVIGVAIASLPYGRPAAERLVMIEIGFIGKLDLSNGPFLFCEEIGSRPFILSDICKPSGGSIVASWFGPSPRSSHSSALISSCPASKRGLNTLVARVDAGCNRGRRTVTSKSDTSEIEPVTVAHPTAIMCDATKGFPTACLNYQSISANYPEYATITCTCRNIDSPMHPVFNEFNNQRKTALWII